MIVPRVLRIADREEPTSVVGGNIRPMRLIHTIIPALPEAARQAGVHEPVIMEILINEDGRVTESRVLRPNRLLEAAALRAVREWR